VRQPCCRASRAHDPARGGAVPRMVIARTNSCISFPFRTPARIPLPARIALVWRAAAMLPRQPCSRSGADCSGLPCRSLMMGMAERRLTACPTACWCR
jgi:hypothetical protein